LKRDLPITEFVNLYELAILLENKHLGNRLIKEISSFLSINNFSKGYTAAFESRYNEEEKMDSLISLFENFYLDHKNEIVDLDISTKKTLNRIKGKVEVKIGEDDFSKEIQRIKTEIWKSKDYKDLSLLCKDGVKIECHKAVISVSPLFKHFNCDMDLSSYPMEFTSNSLFLFLQILYHQPILKKNVFIENPVELFHLCEQSNLKDVSEQIVSHLKSQISEKTCSKMLDFYFDTNLEDEEFWNKIQKCMKTSTPRDLCSMYLKCHERNPGLIKHVLKWILFQMNKETGSSWLAALDEHEIDDQTLWKKLGTTMNPDTFHLWNIFQSKIAKANDKLQKQNTRIDRIEKENTELLDRLTKLEKMFSTK
jgi:hypothetical protein